MSATTRDERAQRGAQAGRLGAEQAAAEPSRRAALAALAGLLLFRLANQLLLFSGSYRALTADDFGRTVMAAHWVLDPAPIWSSFWLPFHTYLFGAALRVAPEVILTPRVIIALIGMAAIGAAYLLAAGLFASRTAGLVAALLLAASPPHVWLSSAPLTEGISSALILACAAGFVAFLRDNRPAPLWLSAAALLLATGFRYEAWMAAIPFSVSLAALAALRLLRRRPPAEAAQLVGAAALPWLYPAIWLLGNYLQTGDPLAFQEFVRTYNARWYGVNPDYARYPQTWFRIDPAATLLLLPATALCLALARHAAVRWYLAFVLVTYAIFAFMHGAQAEPAVNSDRYQAQFVFLTYPIVAGGLALGAVGLPRRWRLVTLALICALVVASQLVVTHRVQNDPVADGLPGGLALRELRAPGAPEPALIEFEYWQSLAVLAGANDIRGIFYDRQPTAERTERSLLLDDPAQVRACLASNRIAFVLLRSPELQARAEGELGLPLLRSAGVYKLYGVPPAAPGEAPAAPSCALSFYGSG